MYNDTSFARSLQIQLRVIGALLMREIITRYGRNNLGFLWLFVEPMLFTLLIAVLWSAIKFMHSSNLPIVAFAITGYSSVLLWRNCANRCSMAIPPNMSLLYHHNVRVLDLFITRILLEVAGASISFVVLASLFTSLGWMELPADMVGVLYGWLLLAWFGASLGLIVGALTAYSEVIERLWRPISFILFSLSGAFFMVDWLPRGLQKFVLFFPMVHGVELLRSGYFGHLVRTHFDVGYLFVACLVMTLVGVALVRDAGRRVEVE